MCVGVFQHEKLERIVNDQGKLTRPSYIAFTKLFIGDSSKVQVAMNPTKTVFVVEHLIKCGSDGFSVQFWYMKQ